MRKSTLPSLGGVLIRVIGYNGKMKIEYGYLTILVMTGVMSACTSIVTAPIDVAGSVASAGISMVGAAGGAVVDITTGGSKDDDQ